MPTTTLCSRSLTFTIPGELGVQVTATEDGKGNLDFTVSEKTTSTLTGDLGGLFFQFNDAKLGTLTATGPQVTLFKTGDDNISNIAPGINMQGAQTVPYDVGIAFGTAGIGANHQDITSTSFVVSDAAHDLTLNDLMQPGETTQFGARVTSIGAPGGSRSDSEKITANSPLPPTANPYALTTNEDQPFTIHIADVATDPNGSPLSFDKVTQPAHGTVTISADGQTLTYTPTLDYSNSPNSPNDSFLYCVHDALGGEDSNTISTTVTPVADPPTVNITLLAPHAGDPTTETRFQVTATSGDYGTVDAGSDFIKSLGVSLTGNVTSGVTIADSAGLLSGGSITTSGNPGQFTDEIDVTAPSGQSISDTLGITAVNAEMEGTGNPATASASASQAITIDHSTDAANPTFVAQNQNIWSSGAAQGVDFSKFLGLDTSFSGKIGGTTLGFGASVGASGSIKFGFQADLNLTAGDFNASLPFNVSLNNTFNKTSDTLEIDPTFTALPGGTMNTTGPGGSLNLDFVFNAMAKAFASATAFGTSATTNVTIGPYNFTKNLVHFTSGQLHGTVAIPGIPNQSVHLTYGWPQVNTSGSAGTSPTNITSSATSQTALGLGVDPIGLAFALADLPDPFKPSLSWGPFTATLDILSGNIGLGAGMKQQFDLKDLGLNASLVLEDGTTMPITSGQPLVIQNALSHDTNHDGSLDIGLQLTPDTTLQNITSLAGQLNLGLTVLKASVTGLGSLGPLANPHTTIQLGSIPVYTNTFPVAFQQQTDNFSIA